jgi:hypothetical protein
MQTWQTLADPISGGIGVSDEQLRVAVPLMGDNAFYRVVANVKLAPAGGGGEGEAIYGYGTEFSKELQSLGQLSLEDFVAMYEPTNQYLPQIFGKGHYLVLDHINSLPNKLPEIYFRLRR